MGSDVYSALQPTGSASAVGVAVGSDLFSALLPAEGAQVLVGCGVDMGICVDRAVAVVELTGFAVSLAFVRVIAKQVVSGRRFSKSSAGND